MLRNERTLKVKLALMMGQKLNRVITENDVLRLRVSKDGSFAHFTVFGQRFKAALKK